LLAKTPEDRYQTAFGLEWDLRRCLRDWETSGRVAEFALGEHDAFDWLLIPDRLYGRARQVQRFVDSFDRVMTTGIPELVLVSGYSGVGKSAVVNELIEAHGGRLWASANEPRGTIFQFTLPVQIADIPAGVS
jgi:AAA ATPase domain